MLFTNKVRFRRIRSRKESLEHELLPDHRLRSEIYELEGQPIGVLDKTVAYELDGEMITCDSASGALSIAEPGSIMATHVHGSASFKIYDETDLGQCEEISAEQLSIHRKSVYEDLELAIHDFRLLFLHPATNEAKEIHCTLVKDCIKSSSGNGYVYQALSYTWGESQERHIIFINGHPFSVTHNLFRALKHLRKAEETRTLWVDAICIDQNSLSEKTHQVGLMREIYRGASQVLVWFGESDVEISRTLDILEERRMFQLLTKDELDPLLQGLAKIFKQPWWSRIWVVQEVLVASKPPLLGCGHRWLSWDDLEVGMRNLKRQDIFGEGAGNRFENPLNFYDIGLMTAESPIYGYLNTRMNDAWSMRKQWWNLEDLLTATCNRKTTQPHDKVFSLLGLTLNGVLDEVPIDYDQPHTVTFQKAMVHVLRSNMSFLVHAMHFQRNDSVPSWCVDFLTLDWPSHARACMFHSSSKELSTTPGRKIRSSVLHNPVNGTIEVIATILGRLDYVNISKCAPPNLQDSEKDRYRQDYTAEHPTINQREFRYRQYECLVHDVQDFRKAAQRALGSQFSQHEVAWMLSTDIVWRTMGNAEPKLDAAEFSLLEAASLDDDYLQLEARAQTNFEQIGKLANRTLEAVTAVSLNLIDKNLFTTDTGFLGQASTAVNAILEGDWLCIIHGCHVPMILRQAPGMTAYKVVTFSWVSTLTEELLYGGVGQRSQKLTLC